ncbi:MAG: hypothetical protein PHT06_04555 [Dehalococcoidales bacterium]|nr:hypothetical protein [Dehalococcoidales bacterium]
MAWAKLSGSKEFPSPAFIQRLRGRFRWQIILRGNNPHDLLSKIDIPRGWIIDVGPIGLS